MATSVLPKPTSPQTRRSIGARRLEVAVDVGDGARLVGRLVEGERGLEGAVVVVGGGERVAVGARLRSA